jgi:threonine synthase
MKLYNTRNVSEVVSLEQAVFEGLASGGGLFLPQAWNAFNAREVEELLNLEFVPRSQKIAQKLLAGEFSPKVIDGMVSAAFSFPLPLVCVSEKIRVLELFHGPTLAFKDFGARFMAQMMQALQERNEQRSRKPITILTATSGDTGAAVADAFHGASGIRVCVLYPKGKISLLQEKLFCTRGGNIRTFAVDGTFDDCQKIVKDCFSDLALKNELGLTSANSINIARLIGQVFYYFEIAARSKGERCVVSVPSGNFGNMAAGLLAKLLEAPIYRFIAATNANDTIPRYLQNGVMEPRPTVATLSNAMDVSLPNNWERIETLFEGNRERILNFVRGISLDDNGTEAEIRELHKTGYLGCPHTAVACAALRRDLRDNEVGIALGTAHPAKFREAMERILKTEISIPEELRCVMNARVLSEEIPNSVDALKAELVCTCLIRNS